MNERIKELFEQVADNFDPEDCMVSEEFLKAIAELIVRECAKVANENVGAFTPGCGNSVLEHFGVKE